MQQIRISLRGKAVILMGKNTTIRKAIRGHLDQNPNLEKVIPHIRGNVGFVFTKEDLNDVREIIEANKVRDPVSSLSHMYPCILWWFPFVVKLMWLNSEHTRTHAYIGGSTSESRSSGSRWCVCPSWQHGPWPWEDVFLPSPFHCHQDLQGNHWNPGKDIMCCIISLAPFRSPPYPISPTPPKSEVHLIKKAEKVGASESTLLGMLKIFPFSYGLKIQQSESIFPPSPMSVGLYAHTFLHTCTHMAHTHARTHTHKHTHTHKSTTAVQSLTQVFWTFLRMTFWRGSWRSEYLYTWRGWRVTLRS